MAAVHQEFRTYAPPRQSYSGETAGLNASSHHERNPDPSSRRRSPPCLPKSLVAPTFRALATPRVVAELQELELQHPEAPRTNKVFFPDLVFESVIGRGSVRTVHAVRWQPNHRGAAPAAAAKDDESLRSSAADLAAGRDGVGQKTYALKALDPSRLREAASSSSGATEAFFHAAKDLCLEARRLAGCQHDHVVALHGVAAEGLAESFRQNQHGYYLLLDRIHETLQNRLPRWKHYQQPRIFKLGKGNRPSSSHPPNEEGAVPIGPPSSSARSSTIHEPRIESRGDLPERLEVAQGIAEAVLYLHQKRIVVRDLSPSTIGFDAHTGATKLFDLAKARSLEESFLDAELVGSYRYMAPENMLCQPSGFPADVYSFGIVFWEILTLHQPFHNFFTTDRTTKKEVFCQSKFTDQVILNKQWRPSCSGIPDPHAKRLVQECWCSSPEARPNAAQVAWRLRNTIGKASPRARRSSKRLSFTSTDTTTSNSSFFHPKQQQGGADEAPGGAAGGPRKKGFLAAFLPRGSFYASSSRRRQPRRRRRWSRHDPNSAEDPQRRNSIGLFHASDGGSLVFGDDDDSYLFASNEFRSMPLTLPTTTKDTYSPTPQKKLSPPPVASAAAFRNNPLPGHEEMSNDDDGPGSLSLSDFCEHLPVAQSGASRSVPPKPDAPIILPTDSARTKTAFSNDSEGSQGGAVDDPLNGSPDGPSDAIMHA